MIQQLTEESWKSRQVDEQSVIIRRPVGSETKGQDQDN